MSEKEQQFERIEHSKQYIIKLLLAFMNKNGTIELEKLFKDNYDMYLLFMQYRVELDRVLNILEGKLSTGDLRTKEELESYNLDILKIERR